MALTNNNLTFSQLLASPLARTGTSFFIRAKQSKFCLGNNFPSERSNQSKLTDRRAVQSGHRRQNPDFFGSPYFYPDQWLSPFRSNVNVIGARFARKYYAALYQTLATLALSADKIVY